tara:strand:- start:430 stop:765 length:336 start_codon:yes stop_codon:yes gene_type:complete
MWNFVPPNPKALTPEQKEVLVITKALIIFFQSAQREACLLHGGDISLLDRGWMDTLCFLDACLKKANDSYLATGPENYASTLLINEAIDFWRLTFWDWKRRWPLVSTGMSS